MHLILAAASTHATVQPDLPHYTFAMRAQYGQTRLQRFGRWLMRDFMAGC